MKKVWKDIRKNNELKSKNIMLENKCKEMNIKLAENIEKIGTLKKEIAMYHKEHEKQEKFQNEIHKEKEDYKEIFEILSAKYKTLKLRNDDLKAELKSNIENSNKRIFEIEKLKREVNNLKCEREILYENKADDEKSFADKILSDNKMYYSILLLLVSASTFLFMKL